MDREDIIVSIEKSLENIKLNDTMKILHSIRLFASNEKSNPKVIYIIEKAISKFKEVGDLKGLVNLFGLQILQLEHLKENIPTVTGILSKMQNLAEQLNYEEGIALSYCYSWYIEKLKGNKLESRKKISKAIDIIDKLKPSDDYIYYFIRYSQGIEEWVEYHNTNSADILEDCVDYFLNNGFYRSLAQTLGILLIIYQRTQNSRKVVNISKKLFSNEFMFGKYPEDIQAISYYLAGLGQLLKHNLRQAEYLFEESKSIFNKYLKGNIYYTYHYCRLLSHIASVKALQGKLEESFEKISKIEELLGEKYIVKNMDEYSKKQVPHTLNLIKFYVFSRIFGFTHKKVQELREKLHFGIKGNYSDSIMLIEFIYNAELSYEQLKDLQEIENASLKRVGNIIDYLIEKIKSKETTLEEQYNIFLSTLENKPAIKDLTFTEKAFSDLLIAQELYSLNRFTDIYQLLKKYEKNIDRIDVLEMRIYMEAFIQVGKFRNGDPLAPALHFMAIKRCRERKFGRLEGILLDQQKTLQKIALNALKY